MSMNGFATLSLVFVLAVRLCGWKVFKALAPYLLIVALGAGMMFALYGGTL